MSNENYYSKSNYIISLIAGGIAGISVDVGLFPIDALKSRVQYGEFNKSINIYSGLKSTFVGSFPSAAGFFITYDYISHKLQSKERYSVFKYMISAGCGECVAVLIRTPFELIKQNLQVGNFATNKEAIKFIYSSEGCRGFYRGYFITVLREIPFAFIQFPLYEYLKNKIKSKKEITQIHYNICGAITGGVAAFITTPIDVIKTKIMTDKSNTNVKHKILKVIKDINSTNKLHFFAGVYWRILFITTGGFFFFGKNEYIKGHLGVKP